MSPGLIDDVNAPKSMQNIVLEVMSYVRDHHHSKGKMWSEWMPPTDFDTYDAALHAIWPDLFKTDPKAALIVSISIYFDIAERWGFQIQPEEIRELVLK